MGIELTERAKSVLAFIDAYTEEKGWAPSFEEIAVGMGMKSRSNIHRVAKKLKELGLVSMMGKQARSTKLTEEGKKFLDSIG